MVIESMFWEIDYVYLVIENFRKDSFLSFYSRVDKYFYI